HAAGHLLGSDASMGRLRGKVWERDGRKVVPTYHPAFLLRRPEFKRDCWQDIQLAMAELNPATRRASGKGLDPGSQQAAGKELDPGTHASDPERNRGSTGR
ncbi:MAG: hypothetical protein V3T22_09250, partial [Planctomycetota bacterium]